MINGPGLTGGPGAMQEAVAARQTQIGGDWFFWIAGFSVVNSLLALFRVRTHFAIGLGTTELFDAGLFGLPKAGTLALDLLAAGFYVLYGLFARKGARWAFVVGSVFYLLDGLLLVAAKDWLAAAFHAYALFRIFQGFQAARQLAALRRQSSVYPGYVPPSSNPSSDVWPPPPAA